MCISVLMDFQLIGSKGRPQKRPFGRTLNIGISNKLRDPRALSLSFFLSFSLSLSFSALILELFVPFNECAYVERHILNNIANGLLELIKQMWAPKRSWLYWMRCTSARKPYRQNRWLTRKPNRKTGNIIHEFPFNTLFILFCFFSLHTLSHSYSHSHI